MRTSKCAYALALCLGVSACSSLPAWMGGSKPDQPKLPGERITVLASSTRLDPDESVKALPVTLPAPQLNADWPQHTGVFRADDSNLSLKGVTKQESATIGDGEDFEHTLVPRPVIGGGMIFVMDAEGNISAHDTGNIDKIRWQSKGVKERKKSDMIGGGLAYDQGKLYATSGRGLVAAIDAATGKELWRKSLNLPVRSAATVAQGKLFIISIDSQIFALSAANGEILWNQRGIGETAGMMNAVSPAVSRNTMIVPYSSGELYALSTDDGKQIWDQSLVMTSGALQPGSVFTGIGGNPVIDGDVVFAVSNGGSLSVLSLIYGQRIWDKPISSINTPWVAGDFLFVLTDENALISFVKYDGRVRWSTQLPSFDDEKNKRNPITWRGPVLVDGKLAVVGSRGKLMLISAQDGKVALTHEIPDDIYTPPVVAGGRMYLVGQNATLYSLQ